MQKAVAVPYVIALILGVAVIGLVGYWFATTGGKFGGQSSKTICDNKFLQWCLTHSGSYTDFVNDGDSGCSGLGSYGSCSDVLGTSVGIQGGSGTENEIASNQKCSDTTPSNQNDGASCTIYQGKQCASGTSCKWVQSTSKCICK